MEQSEESYVLSGRAELPVTHAVVWIGSADGRKIRWSSEQDPEALSVDDRKVTASIERRVVNSCPDCKVMLQAAHVEEAGERAIISEARVFWQRRPGP
ncbi:MAG: hypothetical protein D6689_17410 [Deltaproteobacteria bacterium]|nr:MAG: hypothetical protein D6689_17410 [Deltaproteobacteria bacterium]